MTLTRVHVPQVGAVLTPDVRAGLVVPNLTEFAEEFRGVDVDTETIKQLFEHSLSLELNRETELDGWLAPRLHNLMRMHRRTAADRGFWTWLALEPCREYVFHRWGPESKAKIVKEYRFLGDVTRNAIARLWWYAEMARNGSDYTPVEEAFRSPGTLQYAMELAYSRYRPAALAFVRVANRLDNFESKKQLSKRINAYLSLKALEFMGLPAETDNEYDHDWMSAPPPPVLRIIEEGVALEGPKDGIVAEEVIARLEKWFDQLTDLDQAA